MNGIIDEFLAYFGSIGFNKFIRVFWFFFFFEFIRYFVIEFLAVLFWTISRYAHRKEYEEARDLLMKEAPFVSVIVPGKNEGKHIHKLATSLKNQTYTNYEVIIVDDGSDDDTAEICRSLKKSGLIDHFYRNEVRGGKASGANLALRYAKGKYIVHLDADCSYEPDALEKVIIPFYLNDNLGAVGGNVMVRNHEESLCATMQMMEYIDTISVGRMASSFLGIYRVVSGAFGAFRRDVIDRVGGWDIGPGLDGDITVKIRKMGYDITFEPEAVCYTNAPRTWKALIKQRLRWDKSLIRFRLRKHKDVLYPNQSFRFSNFISFVENITYNLLLNVKWYVYIIDMLINFPSRILFIVPMNLFLYTCSNFFKIMIFSLFRKRKHVPVYKLIPYIPLMVVYMGYFLRIVRSIAYYKEIFFRASYDDPWNPPKSSRHAKAMKI